ncbi:peptidase [Alcanivorax sp. 97CO-6]|nr:peptidase [Alcanivorax sp. 97CO-6]
MCWAKRRTESLLVHTLPGQRPRNSRAILVALLCVCSLSSAADDISQDEALQLRQQGEIVAFSSLLETLKLRYPQGRVLEVELERDDGQLIYEIELLTGDRVVREIEMDARTGQVLDDERDD